MNKHTKFERGHSIVMLVALLLTLIIIGSVSWFVYRHTISNSSNVLLELDSSGSTNTPAWQLVVDKDGSGQVTNNGASGGGIHGNGDDNFKAGTFSVGKLETLLGQLDLNKLPQCYQNGQYPPASQAFGSASFGSSDTLIYKGKLITEFCPNNSTETAISTELNKIVNTANLD